MRIWAEGIFLRELLGSTCVLRVLIKIIIFTETGSRCALVRLDPATISATFIKLIFSSLLLMRTVISELPVVFKCRSVYSMSSCALFRVFQKLVRCLCIVLDRLCLLRDLVWRFRSQHVSAVALDHLLVIFVFKDLMLLIIVILASARALTLALI